MSSNGKVTVSGPGVCEDKDSPDLGLSFAITLASSRAHQHIDSTFYVRLPDGTLTGYTESFHDGSVSVYGKDQLS